MSIAIFAGGCFWCTEAVFSRLQGVSQVEPGYIGGHTVQPDYAQVCAGKSGHAEAVRIRFDDSIISFETLLDVFFTTHDPTTADRQGNDIGSQYRSAIFAQDAAQEACARARIAHDNQAQSFGAAVVTQLEIAQIFWPAEIEHHAYYASHQTAPYCQAVIQPKLAKLRAKHAGKLTGD
ncbi:peptide-methionine (S)-S-oxide reductase MsrA [Craterilacuibacter sp.]|uniref:peptide-methionine (S)-S-oxide reductase MsrA n=1 Tax=Craterilacuibacter sp. TaxID=2870909 RepID=UPI003F387316